MQLSEKILTKEIYAIFIITQNSTDEVALIDHIKKFFTKYQLGKLLKKCNGTKEKGVPAISLLRYKFSNIFVGKSMYMQQQTGTFTENFSKNAFYRFMNSVKTNWLRLTFLVAANIVNNDISKLTSPDRKNVFIIDDSLFNRTGCKKTELSSRVFDHVSMSYQKGYRMLTLCWSDGNSLIPVNSCLLASSKESNIIGPKRSFDKRMIAGKRRELAQTKAPKAMLTLLDNATKAGLSADYLLFDSWFATHAQITDIKSRGIDVIAMIKKSSRIKYEYCGKQLNIKEIYSQNKKRRGRAKYLLSVEQRQNEDYRTLGELFFFLLDEMADITFYRSLAILMAVLMASLCETLRLSNDQISGFILDFESRLPKYLQNALHHKPKTA